MNLHKDSLAEEKIIIRNFQSKDALEVNEMALSAFSQYSNFYKPWNEFQSKISKMSGMPIDIIIAEIEGKISGAVGFVSPGKITNSHFNSDWAVIRMLVVKPEYRLRGIGRRLTEECLKRARVLNCHTIGLHTSRIMEVALSLYLRMGFVKEGDIPDIYGVPTAFTS